MANMSKKKMTPREVFAIRRITVSFISRKCVCVEHSSLAKLALLRFGAPADVYQVSRIKLSMFVNVGGAKPKR